MYPCSMPYHQDVVNGNVYIKHIPIGFEGNLIEDPHGLVIR